jgi:CRP-like cAMP-binding protein
MPQLLDTLGQAPVVDFSPGHVLIEENRPTDTLFVLEEGEVKIVKGGTEICRIAKRGSMFGEISALLDVKPTASVITVKPSKFRVIGDSAAFLASNIETTLEIARLLAHRVRWLTVHYADELDDGESAFWRYR